MNELKIFENPDFGKVRTMEIDGEPYFVGKDVADILGYENSSRDINRHVDEDDRKIITAQNYQNGTFEIPSRGLVIINESGLYSLILSSKLPKAKEFKRWVTSEVLPSIRKHGAYAVDELLNDPELAIKAFTALKEERQKNKQLSDKIEADKPKVIFADAVATSKTSILVGDLAKLLKQNGINIGQNRLFEWLRANGYLMKSGTSKNMPTQKAAEMGLFEVKESTVSNPDGSIRVTKTTKVTGKGQQYFVNKFVGLASDKLYAE